MSAAPMKPVPPATAMVRGALVHDRAVSSLAGVVLLWVMALACAPLAAIRRSDVLRVAS
jgi:hypothetical protein